MLPFAASRACSLVLCSAGGGGGGGEHEVTADLGCQIIEESLCFTRTVCVADEEVVWVLYEFAGDGNVDGGLLLVSSDHPDLNAMQTAVLRACSHRRWQCLMAVSCLSPVITKTAPTAVVLKASSYRRWQC